jgi:uncharacterized protein involved in outer membrane biogenesis
VRIDARKDIPATDLNVRLKGYAVQNVVPALAGSVPISGILNGQARLSGTGMSVRETAANASGDLSVVVPSGEIRQAFAELLGINAGKGLFLLLNKDPRRTELRCAVGDFEVKNGIARARRLVVDTGVVVSNGGGTINLKNETLNLRLEGKSKKPRILRLWAPITVQGQFSKPKLGVETGKVVAQGGVAAALGALVNPIAAILPFVTAGGAKDVDCAALIAQARH